MAGINSGKKWTEEDRKIMATLVERGCSYQEVADVLGRTAFAIECQLTDMKAKTTERKEMEPTQEQLALSEVLMDMKEGEVIIVRGIYSGDEYHITGCEPFLGRGKVTLLHPKSGSQYVEDIPDVLAVMELVDVELTAEYMVSVDGMQAPRKVHDSYASACDEADRLARKHIGNRVRVLKVEHVIMAKHHVEVQECR